jgi:hypothetical protein
MRRLFIVVVIEPTSNKSKAAHAISGYAQQEASMNRKTAGIVFTIGVVVAALADTTSAQNSPGSAALDTSLRARSSARTCRAWSG